jgi:hypothetical protein
VVEFLTLVVLAFAVFVVVAVLASVFGMVMSLVFIPFQIIGWLLRGLGLLLALPLIAVFGAVAFVVLAAGMLMFLLPFLPIALLALGAWWLVRRTRRSAAAVTS